MEPYLRPGAIVFGVPPRKVRAGDVVVVHHENMDKIKRVKEIQSDKVFLIGDNETHSTDSRDFGWLDIRLVMARVVWQMSLTRD